METQVSSVARKQTGPYRWGGVSLFLLGILLLGLNVMKYRVENWWAVFIVLPALGLFGVGRRLAQGGNGRSPFAARLFYAAAFVVLVVALMFLTSLSWAVWWPLMLIAPGLALLYVAGKPGQKPTTAAWVRTIRWTAVSVIGLGGVFLAHTWGLINLHQFGEYQWWGFFVALPAMGALQNGLWLFGRLGYPSLSVIGLLLTALFGGITAVVELLAIPWTSFFGVTAVCLITGGVLLLFNGLRPARE